MNSASERHRLARALFCYGESGLLVTLGYAGVAPVFSNPPPAAFRSRTNSRRGRNLTGWSKRVTRPSRSLSQPGGAAKRNHILKKPNAQLGAPTPQEGCL
jgi:hypothetical protein